MDQKQKLVDSTSPSVGWSKSQPDQVRYGATENNDPGSGATTPSSLSTEGQKPTGCVRFLNKLVRKKVFTETSMSDSDLHRCLTTYDLISLGIGSCICNGVYIVLGQVSRHTAGPAVVLSFLVAGLASAIAALCYAEFASRVPRAGSAYVYSYVTVGELMAFVIGWNLLLEYIIGTASSARAWSMYFNTLIDNRIKDTFLQAMPIHVVGFSAYPDFFTLAVTLLMTALLAVGVRESTRFNNVFTVVNIVVIVLIVVCGLFHADLNNWELTPEEIPKQDAGTGGFFPYGFSGMMSGAATCFYAYVGFDCIATTGEETRDPERMIPQSMVVAMVVILVSYCSVSAVVTLMCPYFLIDVDTPVATVFHRVGWDTARYVIAIGAMCGLSTSLLGSMFPLPRVLYAMGSDGLIFRFLSDVNSRFQTPLIGTVVSGVFAGVLGMLCNLKELVSMMSIGTLLAYTLVGVCVLILRYETDDNMPKAATGRRRKVKRVESTIHLSFLLFPPSTEKPTDVTTTVAKICITAMCVSLTGFCALVVFFEEELTALEAWVLVLASVLAVLALTFLFCITRQPQSRTRLNFKVPLVPFVPAFSFLVNIYLMFKLDTLTWIRFVVWMAIGFSVYFLYGIKHANMGKEDDGQSDATSNASSAGLWKASSGSEENEQDQQDQQEERYDSLGEAAP